MPRGHGLLRRPVDDRSWRDLTVKTGVNKRQVLAPLQAVASGCFQVSQSLQSYCPVSSSGKLLDQTRGTVLQ
jgi:hypothetical protein